MASIIDLIPKYRIIRSPAYEFTIQKRFLWWWRNFKTDTPKLLGIFYSRKNIKYKCYDDAEKALKQALGKKQLKKVSYDKLSTIQGMYNSQGSKL